MSTFLSDGNMVNQCLGFEPKEFLDEVTAMVDEQLENGIEAYKRDLLSIASSKGYKNVTDSVIQEACLKLKEKMKSVYDKNLDKFELYAKRNIFVVPTNISANEESVGNVDQNINEELFKVRERYIELQASCQKLKGDCDDGDALLKDMRSALFNLRVGSQVLDEYEVQPLSKTAIDITQQKESLDELNKKASALVKEMEKVTGPLQGGSSSPTRASRDKGTGINISNTTETRELSNAL